MYADVEGLVRLERGQLIGLAFVLTGRGDHAEDIVQTVVERLLSKDSTRIPDLRGYARKAVVNECLSWRRSLLRRDRLAEALGDRSQILESSGLVSNVDLSRALGKLSRKHRVVVVLRYYLDLDDASIGELVGCAPATVRSRLSRALKHLRSILDTKEAANV